jgi:amino acid transporter
VYAALRRSVGRDFGAALGVAFYLAFTVDVAFYLIGFAETMQSSWHTAGLRSHVQVFPWNPSGTWVNVGVASAALAIITGVCGCGVRVSARVSLVVLGVIIACIGTSLVCLVVPNDDPQSGHTALSGATLAANADPDLSAFNGYATSSLTLMFVLVFPGFTGVLAGSNLSGELRDPVRSIARGTLASLAFVVSTYAAICLTLAASVQRSILKENMFCAASRTLSLEVAREPHQGRDPFLIYQVRLGFGGLPHDPRQLWEGRRGVHDVHQRSVVPPRCASCAAGCGA